jgi:hypothetical protein
MPQGMDAAGRQYGWKEIDALTAQAAPFAAIIDPDDAPFFAAGDIVRQNSPVLRTNRTETAGNAGRCRALRL